MDAKSNEDWRLFCCLPVTRSGREGYIKGLVPPFNIGNITVTYGLPNACALYLGNAYKLYKQSIETRKKISTTIDSDKIPDDLAFSFIESIVGSILFGYSAIEAFANMEIPDDKYHLRQKKKLIVAEGKSTIERFGKIETKLCEIIPKEWNIESPKGKKEWRDFILYKDIRDRLVHLKTVDQKPLGNNGNNIWSILFIQHTYLSPEIVKKLIAYYYDRKKENAHDWYKSFPY